jgi:transcriptional regulator with XRE-family HTH domain
MNEDQRLVEFGKRLKELRTAKGFTQTELAARMETTESAISRAETGKHNPSLTWLLKLSDALEVSTKELFAYLHD